MRINWSQLETKRTRIETSSAQLGSVQFCSVELSNRPFALLAEIAKMLINSNNLRTNCCKMNENLLVLQNNYRTWQPSRQAGWQAERVAERTNERESGAPASRQAQPAIQSISNWESLFQMWESRRTSCCSKQVWDDRVNIIFVIICFRAPAR